LTNPSLLSLREQYLAAQLAGNRQEALRLLVDEGLLRGVPFQDIHLEIIQPAQYEIGRLWQENLPRDAPNGKRVMVSCVEGELHEVGARSPRGGRTCWATTSAGTRASGPSAASACWASPACSAC
jgi:methanogenic corrinoid protein MtbC1